AYGRLRVLEDVSLSVGEGEIVCLLGANGAGKTTTLNCISGLVRVAEGEVRFDGARIDRLRAEEVVARGIVQVPEGREIFPTLSVKEIRGLGASRRRDKAAAGRDLDWVYPLFPRPLERSAQQAAPLSGGEQQMLMIGRPLRAKPRLLMLDEP